MPPARLLGVPLAAAMTVAALGQSLPKTPERPVTDKYYDRTVVDPFRWLEDWTSTEVRGWVDAQNAYTRARLDAYPATEAIRRRVKVVGSSAQPRWAMLTFRPGALFALKFQPPLNQPLLVVLPPAADPASERTIVDPNRIDRSGATTVDFYVPSRDGLLVAVSLSQGGTEDGTVHVFEVATGKELPDRIPRVNGGTAGGSVAWDADSRGLYYTRYPRGNERPAADRDFFQQVYYHALGSSSEADRYEVGREFPRIAETLLQTSPDGRFVLAAVANGDGGDIAHYIKAANGGWRKIADFSDQAKAIGFGADDTLYVVSHRNAPHGAVLKMPPDGATIAGARQVYRAADGDIVGIVATPRRLVINEIVGGPHQLRATDLDGGGGRLLPIPPASTVAELVDAGGDVLFLDQRYTEPAAWWRSRADGGVERTALEVKSAADYRDIVVERVEARSKDGTRIPISILHRRNFQLDGSNPAVLYGYGGYGISQSPSFSATRIVWLEQGGVFAIANIRGGGEFGDEWHRAGHLTNKQNVFDDFDAAVKLLIDRKYTNPAKLAIQGRSNGGLLMAAMLTQHPEGFRAVVAEVGVYDILRSELWPNGAFNVTEYGTVKNPAHFKAMYAYAPYEHIAAGTKYPAVLLTSGTNDPRVNPGDSRRLAARLQAATASGRPVLLRASGAGHVGTSLSEGLAQQADIYSFLFWQLDAPYRTVASGP
jgi:prolyl oligopeptidase